MFAVVNKTVFPLVSMYTAMLGMPQVPRARVKERWLACNRLVLMQMTLRFPFTMISRTLILTRVNRVESMAQRMWKLQVALRLLSTWQVLSLRRYKLADMKLASIQV